MITTRDLCTWCGSTFEPQVTGRSVKRFCSKDCRQSFHAACRIWGEEEFGAGQVSIFQLQTCLARRARRTERDSASERDNPPKPGRALSGLSGERHTSNVGGENLPAHRQTYLQ